mgnify:CR=1 FL=1|jgi:hypothetical protein
MIKPSTYLRAAIFRCESAAATPDVRAGFQRLLENARSFDMDDSAEVVVSRLDFRQVHIDIVHTLVGELVADAERNGQFIMAPADAAPAPDYAAKLRQAVQDVSSSHALLTPLFSYIAVAKGAEPWLAIERRRPPAASAR